MTDDPCATMLARFAARADSAIELDLERLPALLERLGEPHLRLPPVIHIAGTNGKGSTLAMLAAMLAYAGLKVQAFTSPHLVRVAECVTLSSGPIPDEQLAACLGRVEDASGHIDPTAFEALTAAAFLAFAENKAADVLLLEVGMGGRMDTTNVIPTAAVSVITPIALDHMAFLGDTIAEIAGEKAGILRPETPCVANPQHPDAVAVVAQRARSLGTELRLMGRDFRIEDQRRFLGKRDMDIPALSLAGPHQWDNAALALGVLEAFRPDLLPEAVGGLSQAQWPGRLHRLRGGAPEVWVDGGHNAHAARAIAAALQDMPTRELVLIVGLLGNRPVAPFLEPFRPLRPTIIAVPVSGEKAYGAMPGHEPETLAAVARDLSMPALVAGNVEDALAHLPESDETRVLITGSLYLVGQVLADAAEAIASQ